MKGSFRLGKVSGIEISVHYTWLFAFALITWSLAVGFFPSSFRGWSRQAYWVAGALSALLLFASVLIHELAHSLIARTRGLAVRGITLFIFGGVSNINGEATQPWDEFFIAMVGPLTSLALAGGFWVISKAVPDHRSMTAAILSYLTLVNAILAVFNLLPGFPLDGGRVLRSILWASTRSISKATTVASIVGQVFAWLFIGWGVFQILAGDLLGGLWIAFIGWFLNNAADASRQEMTIQQNFRGVKVTEIMDPNPIITDPDTTISDVVYQGFLRQGKRALPVIKEGKLLGIISLVDVKEVPQERWAVTKVQDVMTREPLYTVSTEQYVSDALKLLAEHNVHQILITRDGALVGLLTRADIIRYFHSRQELGLRPTE